MHTTPDTSKTAMAVFYDLRLVSLAVLMLASQLDFASAAVRVFGLHAKGLNGDTIGKPDPFVKVWCGSTFGGQTTHVNSNANPTWSEEFNFFNCNSGETLKLELWDRDLNFDDKLGTCSRSVQNGSFTIPCYLNKGTLFYSYEAK
ncbi:perforin-1-like [Pseudorasbora parva]|uniref:perforin-1-like n=1 Tax=Pseudorasbora parva TaxID=51549 RepID=UPI00351E79F4